jgi:hypothetical protein
MNDSADATERIGDELKAVAERLHPPTSLDGTVSTRVAVHRRRRQTAVRAAAYSLGSVLLVGTVVWARGARDGADPAPASQPVTSVVPGTEQPESSSPAIVVETSPGTVVGTVVETIVGASNPDTSNPDQSQSSSVATEPGQTTSAVTADVSVDDPLPAQADAVTDVAVAEVAVRYAYQHWILVDLDKDLRGRIVENGEQHAELMYTNFTAARDAIGSARIVVDSVAFTDADHADVVFHVMYGSERSPYFPDDLTGTALFQNGSWRITSRSLCLLAFNIGEGCPGQYPDSPTSPAALQLDDVPPGFERQDSSRLNNVVAVEDSGRWFNFTTYQSFEISITAIAGVSTLSDADAVDLLAQRAPKDADVTDVMVGDRPGRGSQSGARASLVYIRSDDLVVTIEGVETLDQLVAIAAALRPASELPSGEPGVNSSVPATPGG